MLSAAHSWGGRGPCLPVGQSTGPAHLHDDAHPCSRAPRRERGLAGGLTASPRPHPPRLPLPDATATLCALQTRRRRTLRTRGRAGTQGRGSGEAACSRDAYPHDPTGRA